MDNKVNTQTRYYILYNIDGESTPMGKNIHLACYFILLFCLGGIMGQKMNPLGFRLGITQSHHSIWFAQPKNYSESLQEDQKIRDFIKNYVQITTNGAEVEGIGEIKIQKRIDLIQVIIYMRFPKLLIEEGKPRRIEELQMNLQKKLNCVKQKLNITISRIANPYIHAIILAEFIAGQLKNRVSFRKAMKKAVQLTDRAGAKGVQVQISGRLGGKEIARVEWIREGRVPLQTIIAKIDYCSYPVRTIYGVLGIKIWIFVNIEFGS